MKRIIFYRPSILVPLFVLAVTLAFPQSRNYLLLQIGISQTKRGNISSLAFGLDRDLLIRPAHTNWEKQNQLIVAVQFEVEENSSDAYLKAHPDETWLLAERIRALLSRCRLPKRSGQHFAYQQDSPAPMAEPEEDALRIIATTRAFFSRITHLCHLAKQQEPKNAYYDLVLAVIAYAESRDAEGRRHLQEASRKPVFDPHHQDLLQRQLLIDRKIAGRPLIMEEIFSAESVRLFRDLSSFLTLSSRLRQDAAQNIRDGNIHEAIKVQETMSQLGSLIVQQSREAYVAEIGSTFMSQAVLAPWEATQKPEHLAGPPSKYVSGEQRYKYVEEFAHQHHLPALSQMLTADLQHRYYHLRAIDRANSARINIYEIALPIVSWNWGVWMLAFITGALAAQMLLLTLRKQLLPVSGALRFTSTAASLLAILLPPAIFYYLWLGSEVKLHQNLGPDILSANISGTEILPAIAIRTLAFCFPLLATFMACGIVAYLFQWRQLNTARKPKVLLCSAAVLLSPLWFPASLALCWILLGDYLIQGVEIMFPALSFRSSLVCALALLAVPMVGSALYLLQRYIRSQHQGAQREYWRTVYSAIRSSLSNALPVFAALYGVFMVTTVVSRQHAEQRIAPFYKEGEMQTFGRRADLANPITIEQFFKYQEKRRARISNRIDW